MRPLHLANAPSVSIRAVYRYYRDLGDVAMDTLYLSAADVLASRGSRLTQPEMERQARTMRRILSAGQSPDAQRTEPLLTGRDVMREFGLRPGPVVGRLLRAVAEAEASGAVNSREEAVALAREIMSEADATT